MHEELANFAARLGVLISRPLAATSPVDFSDLFLELFTLQYQHNAAYRQICDARGLVPGAVRGWQQIPAVPTSAFKELQLTSLAPEDCTAVFYSSGTTGHRKSRHYHNAASLALYERSLWHWFEFHFDCCNEFLILTPPASAVPNSSLVHMFETLEKKCALADSIFTGHVADDGGWVLDVRASVKGLERACKEDKPITVLGTAFSFVHLLDYLAESGKMFRLPDGSRVMETGGYKNRSRVLPKPELHALITKHLGVAREGIICEYGMSELSSQAYDCANRFELGQGTERFFKFPPWAWVQIISPETGAEVAVGETGLIRIFDLANVFSVMAIQTEDLGVRRESGFELIGRAEQAEPRGCSLNVG